MGFLKYFSLTNTITLIRRTLDEDQLSLRKSKRQVSSIVNRYATHDEVRHRSFCWVIVDILVRSLFKDKRFFGQSCLFQISIRFHIHNWVVVRKKAIECYQVQFKPVCIQTRSLDRLRNSCTRMGCYIDLCMDNRLSETFWQFAFHKFWKLFFASVFLCSSSNRLTAVNHLHLKYSKNMRFTFYQCLIRMVILIRRDPQMYSF